jgi:hypothetical protein
MGSHSICDEASGSLTLTNSGCDTLTITASDIQGSFILADLTFPIRLSPGESVTLSIDSRLDTAGANSLSSGSLSFESNSDIPLAPIQLSRGYVYPRSLQISMNALAPASSHESEVVSFALNSLGDLSGVSTLDLDLVYDADLLSDVSLSNGATVSRIATTKGLTRHRIRLTPPFNTELVQFTSTVRLAVNAETPISIENVTLNADDPRFEECVARANASDTSQFTFLYNCGDRTLQDALRKGAPAIRIVSMRPNPVEEKLTLDVLSESELSIDVMDALGKLVSHTNGRDHFEIDTRHLASGVFFVKITGPLGSQIRSLVKQ